MTRKDRPSRSRKKYSPEDLAVLAAQAARAMNALEILILKVSDIVYYSDYFVIASGRSTRQAQSIAENVQRALHDAGRRVLGVEGEREGNWILVDAGDVIVHVFYHPAREFYELEKLWGDAPVLPLPPE